MPFKKLNEELSAKLVELGLHEPLPLQKKAIAKIKSGASAFILGADGTGKTEILIIGILQKLQMKPKGDNPVALVFVKNKQAAEGLAERFKRYTQYSALRVRTVFEERTISYQKDEIYLGADIVIATPKRLSKLYFLNGINLMELQMILIEDAEFLVGTSFHTDINRISESIQKCQHLVFAQKMDDKLARLKGLFMEHASIVQ